MTTNQSSTPTQALAIAKMVLFLLGATALFQAITDSLALALFAPQQQLAAAAQTQNPLPPNGATRRAAEDASMQKYEKWRKEQALNLPCFTDNSDLQCRNKCTTNYYTISGVKPSRGIKKNVWSAARCPLASQSGNPITKQIQKTAGTCRTSFDTLERTFCFETKGAAVGKGKNSVVAKLNAQSQALHFQQQLAALPPKQRQKCQQEIQKLKQLIQKEFSSAQRTQATLADARSCNYKKPVVCVQKTAATGLVTSQNFVCIPKKEGGPQAGSPGKDTGPRKGGQQTGPTGGGVGNGSGSGNPENGAFGNLKKSIGDAFKKLFGNKQGGGDSGGSTATQRHPCESYYYRITHQKTCAPPKPVACILQVSDTTIEKGDPLTVKWRVLEAESHSLSIDPQLGVAEAVSEESGEITLYPTDSGDIVLSATGRGEDNTCSRRISVTVAPGTGVGEYPPVVSCAPRFFQEGEPTTVTVSWQCRGTEAAASTGVGFDTGGAVSGSATVAISQTTRFTVRCTDESGSFLGENSCTTVAENPLFDIIAYPQEVSEGKRVRLSWGSLGMSTCRVTGPNDFSYEALNAVALTVPFPAGDTSTEAIFTIECASKYGGLYTKDVSVRKQ